jgi:hypothetical protein
MRTRLNEMRCDAKQLFRDRAQRFKVQARAPRADHYLQRLPSIYSNVGLAP